MKIKGITAASKIKQFLIKSIATLCLSAALALPGVSLSSNSINAFTITKDTLAALPSCLDYQVVGVCFWLVCGFGCHIEKTLKVDHYLPDVVITTYPKYGKDPWTEVNKTIDVVDHNVGNKIFSASNSGMQIKGGSFSSANSSDSDVKLREVDVIGNPALAVLRWKRLLKGQASPYAPYYQSQLDAKEWRSGLLEQLYPDSWIPGKDDVGTFLLDEWGATYPRTGFIMQPNVGKASAVIAVRGGNIASTHSFDHISKDFAANPCPEEDCTTAGAILSDASKTKWQMLLPTPQTTCHAKIDYSARPSWVKHQPDDQTYSWVVWREYRGCINGDGVYLGSVG